MFTRLPYITKTLCRGLPAISGDADRSRSPIATRSSRAVDRGHLHDPRDQRLRVLSATSSPRRRRPPAVMWWPRGAAAAAKSSHPHELRASETAHTIEKPCTRSSEVDLHDSVGLHHHAV